MSVRALRSVLALVAAVWVIACGDGASPSENPTPDLRALSPDSVPPGAAATTITVSGADFVRQSVVRWNGADRPTSFVNRSQLRVTIPPSDLTFPQTARITVFSPAPGGGLSNEFLLRVRSPSNPAPKLTSLLPDNVTAGSGDVVITLVGSDFLATSTVTIVEPFTTLARTGASTSSQLTVTIPAARLAASATLQLVVTNPYPGGGTSAPMAFTVGAPTPTVASLAPASVLAGAANLALTVNGTGFIVNSVVQVGGSARPTRFESANRLVVTLPASDLREAGTLAITVMSPAPGGGTTAAVALSVATGTAVITSLPSYGASAGRPGFTLVLDGANFVPSSVVTWNGQDRPTVYRSGSRLGVVVSAGDVAAPGSVQIAVRNPAPAGVSNAVSFTIRPVPAATVTDQRTLYIAANDLVYDPRTARLYVTVSSDGSAAANTVAAIDPTTGQVTGSVFVGDNPGVIALSDDGQYLHVSVAQDAAVRRVRVNPLTAELQFTLGTGTVANLLAVPGSPLSVAVGSSSCCGAIGVTIYDAGIARPKSAGGPYNSLAFRDATTLYAFESQSTAAGFFVLDVGAEGVTQRAMRGGVFGYGYAKIRYASGRVYWNYGGVLDPELLEPVAQMTAASPVGSFLVDPQLGRAFYREDYTFYVTDLNTYQLLDVGYLPQAVYDGHPANARGRLVRWGTDGFAFRVSGAVVLFRAAIGAP